MNILISDIFYRKSFDVFNCIKRAFPTANFLLTSENYSFVNQLKTKYLYGNKLYLLQKISLAEFSKGLEKISLDYANETIIYIPVEEDTTKLFLEFIKQKGKMNFRFSLPELSSFIIAQNKLKLNQFCADNTIPAPLYFTKNQIETLPDDFKIIAKPQIGSGSAGIFRNTAKNLKNNLDFNNYLLQEEIPNGKNVIGTFFLCNKGEIMGSYCHQRRRTYPQEGGVTVLSEFMTNNEALQTAKKLLQKLQWSGLAMVECLLDERDEQYKVIEVNPRLWGSILLSEFSGAALLENYVRLCADLPLKSKRINTEAKIRWVFPYDVINWFKGKISTKALRQNDKNTCFINGSYASFFRSVLFHITLIFNRKNY